MLSSSRTGTGVVGEVMFVGERPNPGEEPCTASSTGGRDGVRFRSGGMSGQSMLKTNRVHRNANKSGHNRRHDLSESAADAVQRRRL
jgi:hypothetical protein